jgi:hypothetical protein
MGFIKYLFYTSIIVNFYYLYDLLERIPVKYVIPEMETDFTRSETARLHLRRRGGGNIIGNYREMHKRKHPHRSHLRSRKSGNNTA